MREPALPPLQGLVLTGGASARMGSDKAALVYHGEPQWRIAGNILRTCGAEPFWSCSASQASDWDLGRQAILDMVPGHGPASGLHAAFSRGDHCAWLVIGCDYPALEAQDLQQLVAARTVHFDAVTYLNPETHDIEPMITLWEPAAQQRFLQAFDRGETSARRVLATCALHRLAPRSGDVLENRNRFP
jgi:molybdopterin-guanine dinucleotide biosynthesis protein A